MRALPALSVTVARHRAWNTALAGVALLALAALAGWGHAWRDALGPVQTLGLGLPAFGLAWLVRGLWRRGSTPLRWDGAQWHVGLGESRALLPCDLNVALDFGSWMLLRCRVGKAGAARRRTVWLPVERAGLRETWHALRCAVYSPRSDARPVAGAER